MTLCVMLGQGTTEMEVIMFDTIVFTLAYKSGELRPFLADAFAEGDE
jgi:hypothetical protein